MRRQFRAPLLTISLGIALFAFNEFLVSTALPSAVRAVGGIGLMSGAVTVYLVPSIVAGSCAATLKQRLGERRALFLAGLVFLAGTLLASAAPTMGVILLGRALQGAGDGLIASLCYALIPALFPAPLIQRVFGVESLIWATSAFAGPALAGWVTQAVSWRAAFLVNVPLVAVFLLLVPRVAARRLRAAAPARALRGGPLLRLSGIAAGILLVSLAGLVPGAASLLCCLLAALALLVCSVRADAQSPSRLFPPGLFRLSSPGGATYWTILLMPLAQAVSGVYLVLALQRLWGLRPAAAGAIGAAMAVSWSVCGFAMAGLPVWRARLSRLGPALNMAGLCGLLVAMRTGSLPVVIVSQVAVGASFGLCWAMLSQSVMQDVAPAERDRATALLPTVQSAGYAIGAAIAGLVANLAGIESGALRGPIAAAYGVAVLIALAAVLADRGAAARRARTEPRGSSIPSAMP